MGSEGCRGDLEAFRVGFERFRAVDIFRGV